VATGPRRTAITNDSRKRNYSDGRIQGVRKKPASICLFEVEE
jgi:hypothetical protein